MFGEINNHREYNERKYNQFKLSVEEYICNWFKYEELWVEWNLGAIKKFFKNNEAMKEPV